MQIDSAPALSANIAALLAQDPVLADICAAGVVAPLRKRDPGFAGLIDIVIGQQVSVASAAAISRRLRIVLPQLSAGAVAAASDSTLQAIGLSRPKIRTLRHVAQAAQSGSIDFAALSAMPAASARRQLEAINGIGPWTADIYLLFCLGHPDVLPSGDLAIQEAARCALHLDARPDATTLAVLAKRWQPYRGAAALILWAYYARLRGRAGVISLPPATAVSANSIPSSASAWRPPLRVALEALRAATAAMPTPPGDLTPRQQSAAPEYLETPDLIEGLLSATAHVRLASTRLIAPSIAHMALSCAHDADREDIAAVLVRQLLVELNPDVQAALLAAISTAAWPPKIAGRMFQALQRRARHPETATDAREAARSTMIRLAAQHPHLTPRLQRFSQKTNRLKQIFSPHT